MLHQKAFTALCYLIDVHSSQGQAQDNCRSILLLILKEESKVNLQRPCSCSGTYCRRGSRTPHQADAISSFGFYYVCKVHLALLTPEISKIPSCWEAQASHHVLAALDRESCSFSDLRVWTITALRGTL